jgi:hypothetical protein
MVDGQDLRPLPLHLRKASLPTGRAASTGFSCPTLNRARSSRIYSGTLGVSGNRRCESPNVEGKFDTTLARRIRWFCCSASKHPANHR